MSARAAVFGGMIAVAALLGAEPAAAQQAGSARGLVVKGKTQPAPGRHAFICPVVADPVEAVLVRPGDRVKKGQPLLKHDDAEARAKVMAKRAALKSLEAALTLVEKKPRQLDQHEARQAVEEARLTLSARRKDVERLARLWESGATSVKTYRDARLAYEKAQGQLGLAQAKLERLLKEPVKFQIAEAEAKVAEARAELEAEEEALQDFTIRARLDGVVTSLRAGPGLSARPGTAVWGEIVDVSELDVRCELTPRQARALKVGQSALVRDDSEDGPPLPGRVALVGVVADPASGRIPVLVRVPNPHGRLFCHVEVTVEFEGTVQARAPR